MSSLRETFVPLTGADIRYSLKPAVHFKTDAVLLSRSFVSGYWPQPGPPPAGWHSVGADVKERPSKPSVGVGLVEYPGSQGPARPRPGGRGKSRPYKLRPPFGPAVVAARL